MKKISKLKLTQLSKAELAQRQMNVLRGGARVCTCSCKGPSSNSSNRSANYDLGDDGGYSASGCNQYGQFEEEDSYITDYCSYCTA